MMVSAEKKTVSSQEKHARSKVGTNNKLYPYAWAILGGGD